MCQETLISANNSYITQKSLPRRIFPWQLLLTPFAVLQFLIAGNRKDKISLSLSLWGITYRKGLSAQLANTCQISSECGASLWFAILVLLVTVSRVSITVQSAFTLSAQISSLWQKWQLPTGPSPSLCCRSLCTRHFVKVFTRESAEGRLGFFCLERSRKSMYTHRALCMELQS